MPRSALSFALAFALSQALAACQPAAAPPDTAAALAPQAAAPVDAAQPSPIGGDALTAYLASVYGAGARAQGEWSDVPADAAFRAKAGETATGDVTRRVCEREETTLGDQRVLLLAVCGAPKDAGHVTAGLTDLFVLEDAGGRWVARASGHFEEFGSMGDTGEVDAERLGAALPGFIVRSSFTGQGHTVANRTVLLPKDGRLHEAARFLAGMDDDLLREGCNDDPATCPPGRAYDLDFDLEIDDRDPSASAYPLVVREQGNACGRPVNARHVLTLDAATLTYAVPAALKRETAC